MTKKGLEEILKIGVVDYEFGPKIYVCYLENQSTIINKPSIKGLAEYIVNRPPMQDINMKITYDNKSGVKQYKDVRSFTKKELNFFKEMLTISRYKRRVYYKQRDSKNIWQSDKEKDNRKVWIKEKHPYIK